MEYTEKPKRSEHDSRPFLVAGLVTAGLWYVSLGCPATLWLKPPLTELTPMLNITCVMTPLVVIAAFLLYHGMSRLQKILMALFGLATCAAVTWVVLLGMLTSYGPCERHSGSTQVCLMYDPDNVYAYTFASSDYVPFIMVMTGFVGAEWEENACYLIKMDGCGEIKPRIK